jgi:hypothetical protein
MTCCSVVNGYTQAPLEHLGLNLRRDFPRGHCGDDVVLRPVATYLTVDYGVVRPQYTVPFLKTPVFTMMSKYDIASAHNHACLNSTRAHEVKMRVNKK